MDRRALLRHGVTALAGTVALTGCVDETTDDTESDTPGQAQDRSQSTTDQTDRSNTSSDADGENMPTETDETDKTDETDGTDEPAAPTVDQATLAQQPACGDTTVRFETDTVVVSGCVRGPNGCHQPAVHQTAVTDGVLTLTVESVEKSGETELCSSVIVENGYTVTMRIDGPLPDSVRVVHDDMDGRQTVTTAQR